MRGYDLLAGEAQEAGAAAFCLSGAGPTMLAVCDRAVADAVANRMRQVLDSIGIEARVLACQPDMQGVVVQF